MSEQLNPARTTVTGCVRFAGLFQDPLLEEPPTTNAPAQSRRRYVELEGAAEAVCQSCPLLQQCLYRAVVQHDVAGYAAATTKKQRLELRRRLRVTVDPEDLDTLAGVSRHHRQVNHAEVVRLRAANPDESLEQLAQRLSCSLSTVKRHLRHERRTPTARPLDESRLPSEAEVMAAFVQLTADRWVRHDTAA